mgnify:CR=1 FL=1
MLKSLLNHTTQHVSLSDFYTRTMKQFVRTIEDAFVNREERSQAYINIDEDSVDDESQVTIAINNNNIESDEAEEGSTNVEPSSNENAEQSDDDNDYNSDCEIVGVEKKRGG